MASVQGVQGGYSARPITAALSIKGPWTLSAPGLSSAAILVLYTAAIFCGATLLFLVQPMFARMVLPTLGGSPSVWNTAMVFYQAVLLAGYAYAHSTTAKLGVRRQAILHLALLALPLLTLPIRVPADWSPPTAGNPSPWLLGVLSISVGLPFFVVSATSPVIQKWFAATGHRSGKDPYFLYAASNVGSMLALIAYPLLAEPLMGLTSQSWVWTAGYGLYALLVGGCAVTLWRSAPARLESVVSLAAAAAVETVGSITASRRLRWVALAFIPSSLMLGVTTYLSTNIAAIPLLWVIPLALYLLTFILVFAGRPVVSHRLMLRAMPIFLLALVAMMVMGLSGPLRVLLPLNLVVFFIASMVCHGELAHDRPAPSHLTEFYLWLSVGGVLGGAFNALAAPLLFSSILEYPLTLAAACLLVPALKPGPSTRRQRLLDFALPVALALVMVAIVVIARFAGARATPIVMGALVCPPAFVCFSFRRRPIRFGLGIAGLVLAGLLLPGVGGDQLHAERTFFGTHRIFRAPDDAPTGPATLLAHGTITHGMQSLDPARRLEPLMYYHRTGPVGQLFTSLAERGERRPVAVVGLGAGALACYGAPGQAFTFHEIDPAVERIARDPRYFTYLRDCPPAAEVVLGDARLTLASAPSGAHGVIVLDAYSADAIPTHLLTREAFAIYLAKLAPGGVLAFHISNLYFDLEPVISALAQDAGLTALIQKDRTATEEAALAGKSPSHWMILARSPADLAAFAADERWSPAMDARGHTPWTDDLSSPLPYLKRP